MTAKVIAFPERRWREPDCPIDRWVSENHIDDYGTFEEAVDGIRSYVLEGWSVTIEPLAKGGFRLFFDTEYQLVLDDD